MSVRLRDFLQRADATDVSPSDADMEQAGRRAGAAFVKGFRSVTAADAREVAKLVGYMNRVGYPVSNLSAGSQSLVAGAAATSQRLARRDQSAARAAAPSGTAAARVTAVTDSAGPSWAKVNQTLDRFLSGGAIGKVTSLLLGMGGVASKVLGQITSGFNSISTAAGSVFKSVSNLPTAFVGLSAAIYSVTSVGAAIKTFVLDPIADIGRFMLNAGEDARKFAFGLGATLGSVSKAWEVSDQLVGRSRQLTASVHELREAALTLGSLPGLSGRLSYANGSEAAAVQVEGFANLIRKLSAVDASQGAAGALLSVRNLAEGGPQATTSVRRRFGISGKALARQISGEFDGSMRAALDAIAGDPDLATRALGKYLDSVVPQATVDRYQGLISSRVEHLFDALRATLAKVSEAGPFDAISDRLKSITDSIFDYWSSPRFTKQADRIGAAVGKIINNLGSAVATFLGRLTGGNAVITSVGDGVELLAASFEKLAEWSDFLPTLAGSLIDFAKSVGPFMADAVGSVKELAAAVKDLRTGGAKSLIFGTGPALPSGLAAVAGMAGRGTPATRPSTRPSVLPSTLPAVATAAVPALAPRVDFGLSFVTRVPNQDDLPASVRALLKDRDTGPAWAARQQTLASILGRIEAPSDTGGVAAVARAARGVLGANLSGDPKNVVGLSNLFDVMGRDLQRTLKKYDDAIENTRGASSTSSNPSKLTDALTQLDAGRAEAVQRYQQATRDTADLLTESAKDFGESMADALKDVPPFAEAALRERVAAGATDYADKIVATLGKAGFSVDRLKDLGIDSLPIDRQQKQVTALIDARLKAYESQGELGPLSLGMGAAEVRAAYGRRLDDDAVAAAQLRYLQGDGLARQSALLAKAKGAYDSNPKGLLESANLAQAEEAYGNLIARTEALGLKVDKLRQAYLTFGEQARDSIQTGLGDALYNVTTQTGTLADAMKSLANSVARSWSNMVSQLAMDGLVGNLFQKQQNGSYGAGGGLLGAALGSLFGLGGGGQGAGAAAGGAVATAAANGAVFDGHLSFLANGGVVDKPRLAVVGERVDRTPELVAPLLGPGRTVPLGLDGDGLHVALPGGRKVAATLGGGLDWFSDGGLLHRGVTTYGGGSASPGGLSLGVQPLAGAGGAVDVLDQSGGDGPRIYVVQSPEELWARGYRKGKDHVVNTISGEIRRGGRVAKSIKRMSRT